MTAKLTPWFPGHIKPVRVGVYQLPSGGGEKETGFQYWNGSAWGMWTFTATTAYLFRGSLANDMYQNDKWHGLAKEPK